MYLIFNIFFMPERCLKKQKQQKQNQVTVFACSRSLSLSLLQNSLSNLAQLVFLPSPFICNIDLYYNDQHSISTLFGLLLLFAF